MRIKDIKAGGWVRTGDSIGRPELLKVTSFSYDRSCVNGYCFHFRGLDYGLLLERKDFKYSDNVEDLIKKNERVLEYEGKYIICNGYSKDEFIKLCREEKQ